MNLRFINEFAKEASKRALVLACLFIFLFSCALRLPGIGTFMTADEGQWMLRSAEFYHKLFRLKDPGGTFLTTHPGATAMWLIGLGETIQEKRLGVDVDESTLLLFRRSATLPIALTVSFFLAVVTYSLIRLLGLVPGILTAVLISAEPFFVGLSQIAHLDALLAIFMLNAVVAFLLYIRNYSIRPLLMSGLFTGLAISTKLLPALWLFVVIVMIMAFLGIRRIEPWRQILLHSLFFVISSLVIFFILWPVLWVKPYDMIGSFEKDTTVVIQDPHTEFETSDEPIAPASFYIRSVVSRLTPFSLIVSTVTAFMVLIVGVKKRFIPLPAVIWFIALGFLVIITFVAKKGDRYALPAMLLLVAVAGIGISKTLLFVSSPKLQACIVGGFITLVGVYSFLLSPHAISYHTPLWDIRPAPQQGWGEGLEEAAAYIATTPLGKEATVASWYPSIMATYFPGKTMSLSSRNDPRVGYVVTYRNMHGRSAEDDATGVLEEFQDKTPVHVISIQGEPYAWIYQVFGIPYFPKHIDELLPGQEVGQLIPVIADNWNSVEIGFSTFSDRRNTSDVIVHIRDSVASSSDLRTISRNAADIIDSDWNTFSFEPIPNSAGKTFYVAITSPQAKAGNAVTVRFTDKDILPGQMVWRRRSLQEGETNESFLRAADMAYRIP